MTDIREAGAADQVPSPTAAPRRLRTVALPAEHGSWGLTTEPILLGLLAAPSWAGAVLAGAAFGLFLVRWPLKVLGISWRQRRPERIRLAAQFVVLYGTIATVCLIVSVALAGWEPLAPLVAALPFAAVFVVYDAKNQSRSWQAELAGPVGFSAVATTIALAAGWPAGPAAALWGALVARSVPAVLFVRARIRLDKGRPYRVMPTIISHLAALAAMAWLANVGILRAWVVGVYVLLLIRAAWGLSRFRRTVPIKVVGFSELAWGVVTVVSVAVGVRS